MITAGDDAPEQPRLSETSYVVLGLVDHLQPATPYDLKTFAELSTFDFWSVPHTRLYTECARLADAGLLLEEREQGGRRRRFYRTTERGGAALSKWLSEPTRRPYELRDEGTLKLFLGAEPASLAEGQLELHRPRLARYEELLAQIADAPEAWRLALAHGIGHEREFIRFWTRVAAGESPLESEAS